MSSAAQAAFASAIALTLLASTPAGAQQTQTPHPFRSASISLNPHRGATPQFRIAHDGTRYTHLEGRLDTRFRIKAKVKSGYRIGGFVLATIDPTNLTDNVADVIREAGQVHVGAETDLAKGARTIDRNVAFSLDARQAFNGILPIDQAMVDMCNTAHPELPSEDSVVSTAGITVFAGFSWHKRSSLVQAGDGGWGFSEGRPAIAFTTIEVEVVCSGKPVPRAAGLPPTRAKPKPVSVALGVDQRGETCPKTVTVKAYADYKSPATATMRMLPMGKRIGKIRKVETRRVEAFGKVWHRAETAFSYTLDPGEKTFRLRVDGEADAERTVTIDCPPFKVISAWLKYEVKDNGICPKEVVETATFKTTRPGWVDFVIKHQSGLPAWQDRLTARRSGGGYSATHVRTFTVGEFSSQFMADVKNSPANSGWVGLKVECPVVPAVTGASNDMKPRRIEPGRSRRNTIVKTAPDATGREMAEPSIAPRQAVIGKPPKWIKPTSKPVCQGGRLVKASSGPTVYRCLCPLGKPRQVRKGWLCPARLAPRAAKPLCRGGVVRSGKCACGPSKTLIKGTCRPNAASTRIKARTFTKTSPAFRDKALTGKKRVKRRKTKRTLLPGLQPVR